MKTTAFDASFAVGKVSSANVGVRGFSTPLPGPFRFRELGLPCRNLLMAKFGASRHAKICAPVLVTTTTGLPRYTPYPHRVLSLRWGNRYKAANEQLRRLPTTAYIERGLDEESNFRFETAFSSMQYICRMMTVQNSGDWEITVK